MTLIAKTVILTAEDVKDAKLSEYRLIELEDALSEAGYDLIVQK